MTAPPPAPDVDAPTTEIADCDTVDGARVAARHDGLDRWVAEFLASPGSDNAELAEELASRDLDWHGPFRLTFDSLHRLAGPPDQPTVGRLGEDDLEKVEAMKRSIEDGWEPAPLVVTVSTDFEQLVVEDGNHRIEALRRAGVDDHWAVVGTTDRAVMDKLVTKAAPIS